MGIIRETDIPPSAVPPVRKGRSQVWSQLAVIAVMLAILSLVLRWTLGQAEAFGLDADVFLMFYLLKLPMGLGVLALFCLAAALFDMVIYGETMKLIGGEAMAAAVFYGLWFVGLGITLAAVFG